MKKVEIFGIIVVLLVFTYLFVNFWKYILALVICAGLMVVAYGFYKLMVFKDSIEEKLTLSNFYKLYKNRKNKNKFKKK
jgi:uncharacterized membrane protein YdbT with pleckstrin-like domain